MHPILRNVVAIIAGFAAGMLVIMIMHALIAMVIPLPAGIDPSNPESFRENVHLFTTTDFVLATVAHALGTLTAAFVAAKIVANNKSMFGLVMGIFFLVFGVMNSIEIGAPGWVTTMDLIVAYLPMGWLGGKLAGGDGDKYKGIEL